MERLRRGEGDYLGMIRDLFFKQSQNMTMNKVNRVIELILGVVRKLKMVRPHMKLSN